MSVLLPLASNSRTKPFALHLSFRLRRTSKMSHADSRRDSCASTRHDGCQRWLWCLVGLLVERWLGVHRRSFPSISIERTSANGSEHTSSFESPPPSDNVLLVLQQSTESRSFPLRLLSRLPCVALESHSVVGIPRTYSAQAAIASRSSNLTIASLTFLLLPNVKDEPRWQPARLVRKHEA